MENQPQAEGIAQFFEQERTRILDACTSCGRCYEVCPMTPGLDAKPGSSQEAVTGVLAILRESAGDSANDAAALEWVESCTHSGLCVPACPHSVNPKLMLRLARIKALGSLGGPKLLHRADDPNWFPRVYAFSVLQLSEDERKEWM